jgi:hypothetical protein
MIFFNWEYYVCKYPDLININNKEKALNHWVKYGKNEERIYTDIPIYFNWKEYLFENSDLIESGINTEETAWRHFIYHGFMEKRYSSISSFVKIYCVH